jgi:hypothetical protein
MTYLCVAYGYFNPRKPKLARLILRKNITSAGVSDSHKRLYVEIGCMHGY